MEKQQQKQTCNAKSTRNLENGDLTVPKIEKRGPKAPTWGPNGAENQKKEPKSTDMGPKWCRKVSKWRPRAPKWGRGGEDMQKVPKKLTEDGRYAGGGDSPQGSVGS